LTFCAKAAKIHLKFMKSCCVITRKSGFASVTARFFALRTGKEILMEQKQKLWSRDFVLIITINFLVFMNHIMLLSTFPFYIESLGGSETLAGLAAALFSLVAVLCRPLVGWLLDGGRRRGILIIGLCGMALMPLGYLAASSLFLAFVCRMAHGASLALSNTSTATIASDVMPKSRFSEGMGMFGMATALATSCAPALGLYLMNRFGFSVLFICAACSIAAAALLLLLMRIPVPRRVEKPFSPSALFSRSAVPASAIALVFMLTFGALENFLAKFASDNSLPSGGLYFAVMAVMLLLVRFFLGSLTDRRGEGIFVYSCNAAMFAAFLLLAFAAGKVTFIISAVLAGYGFGGLEPALQSMAVHTAPPDERGSANSTFLCAYDIGIGLGGGAAGALIDAAGYNMMFAILSAANIVSVLLYVFWGRHDPSSFSAKAKRA
jgi:predicted MFS family arabinose efflux permease